MLARFLIALSLELVSPPHETLKELEKAGTRAGIFLHLFSVSWGELTSSKLIAPSYDDTGKQVLIP